MANKPMTLPGGILAGIESGRPQFVRATKPEDVQDVGSLIEAIAQLVEMNFQLANRSVGLTRVATRAMSELSEVRTDLQAATSRASTRLYRVIEDLRNAAAPEPEPEEGGDDDEG